MKYMFSTCINDIVHIPVGKGDRRGHNRMIVGFITTCAISAYHH